MPMSRPWAGPREPDARRPLSVRRAGAAAVARRGRRRECRWGCRWGCVQCAALVLAQALRWCS
jgi:hypothetical protein